MLGVAMASGLLLFTLYGVRFGFFVRKPRDRISVSISLIGLISLLLIGSGLLLFTRYKPPIIPGPQGPKQINTLFGSDGVIVATKILHKLFLHHYRQAFFELLVDNTILEGHAHSVPGGFMILIIIPDRKR